MNLRTLLLFPIVVLGIVGTFYAQTNLYCVTSSIQPYEYISSGTPVPGILSVDEDVSDAFNIGFPFEFNNQTYNEVKISTNGWLTFNTAVTDPYPDNNAVNAVAIQPALFPLWDDLLCTSIPVYEISGTAPNRICRVEWTSVRWDKTSQEDEMTFQILLYETSNIIGFNYFRLGNSNAVPATALASIGLFDETFNVIKSGRFGTDILNFVDDIHAKPTNNRLYTFTPSVAWSATDGTALDIVNKSIVFDTDLDLNFSATICNCKVETGKTLTLKTPTRLTVTHHVINEGALILENDAALVQRNNSGVVTGEGFYQLTRETNLYNEYDYTYWSSPSSTATVENSLVASGSNANYIFTYNTQLFADQYNQTSGGSTVGFPQVQGVSDGFDDDNNDWTLATGIMEPGKGYIAMGAGADFPFDPNNLDPPATQTVVFEGKFNYGTFTIPILINTLPGGDNSNFIGNPYPSALNIQIVKRSALNRIANDTIIEKTARFWSHDTAIASGGGPWAFNYTNSDFATLNIESGIGTAAHVDTQEPTIHVASGQGFFVDGKYEGVLTITNSMRSTGVNTNSNFFKNAHSKEVEDEGDEEEEEEFISHITEDVFWLDLKDENGLFRQIAIGFDNLATDGVDSFDSERITLYNEPEFYSTIENNEKLNIQIAKDFNMLKTIQLGYSVSNTDAYSISLAKGTGIFSEGQTIFIEDTNTDIIHDLSIGAYTFTAEAATNVNDRFVLRFVDGTAGNSETALATLKVYPNPSTGVFNVSYHGDETLQYSIYDLTGKQIANGTGNQINLSQQAVGMYYVKIMDGKSARILKLVRE